MDDYDVGLNLLFLVGMPHVLTKSWVVKSCNW